uniref:Uncharacterized protein n=1 Tax=Dulem virus 34 TaxID=3145752 RepID=A0AAU8B4U4_9CAUD
MRRTRTEAATIELFARQRADGWGNEAPEG